MRFLVIRAYLDLIRLEPYIARGGFGAVYARVHSYPVGTRPPSPDDVQEICAAVDIACIWYWKEVLCLQRSTVTACLLRRLGASAEMVIGVQHLPFKAHAWVEVNGLVVNDRPYVSEVYAVLDRY